MDNGEKAAVVWEEEMNLFQRRISSISLFFYIIKINNMCYRKGSLKNWNGNLLGDPLLQTA